MHTHTHNQKHDILPEHVCMTSCLWRMELNLPTDLGRLVNDLFYQKWRPLLLQPCLFWRVSKMTSGNMLSIDVIFRLFCWLVIHVVPLPHKHSCRDEKWSTRAAPQHFLSKKGIVRPPGTQKNAIPAIPLKSLETWFSATASSSKMIVEAQPVSQWVAIPSQLRLLVRWTKHCCTWSNTFAVPRPPQANLVNHQTLAWDQQPACH